MARKKTISERTEEINKPKHMVNFKESICVFIDDDDYLPSDKQRPIISWNLIIFIIGIISLIAGSICVGLYGHALIAVLMAIYGIPLIYNYDNDNFIP